MLRKQARTIGGMIQAVLDQYLIGTTGEIVPLGNAGGFSGCQLWRLPGQGGDYCLRRWPTGTRPDRLRWIHDVLYFAHDHGCHPLVAPLRSRSGCSLVEHAGQCWELMPWATGSADFATRSTADRLKSAIEFLADFHRVTAKYHLESSVSANLQQILFRLENYDAAIERLEQLLQLDHDCLSREQWQQFKRDGAGVRQSLLLDLNGLQDARMPVQPVIRDIRVEHLFFVDDSVSAVIDFGAMRLDTVACDVSRMLGSMIGDDPIGFPQATEWYHQHRPLSGLEHQLIDPMNRAGVLIGLLNWLEWVVVENRQFESMVVVRDRIGQLLHRLHCINLANL